MKRWMKKEWGFFKDKDLVKCLKKLTQYKYVDKHMLLKQRSVYEAKWVNKAYVWFTTVYQLTHYAKVPRICVPRNHFDTESSQCKMNQRERNSKWSLEKCSKIQTSNTFTALTEWWTASMRHCIPSCSISSSKLYFERCRNKPHMCFKLPVQGVLIAIKWNYRCIQETVDQFCSLERPISFHPGFLLIWLTSQWYFLSIILSRAKETASHS